MTKDKGIHRCTNKVNDDLIDCLSSITLDKKSARLSSDIIIHNKVRLIKILKILKVSQTKR